MLKHSIGISSSKDAANAVFEATKTFSNPKLIIFFASLDNFEAIAKELYSKFKTSTVIGMSSLYQISNGAGSNTSLMVTGIESGIEVTGGFIPNISKYPVKHISDIQSALKTISPTKNNTTCLEFCSGSEEKLMSAFHSVISTLNIPLAGATAAGELGVCEGLVCFNEFIGRDACAYVFIKNLSGKIKIYKENIYKPTGTVFTATKTDPTTRTLFSLNHMPTLQALANPLGIRIDQVFDYTLTNPLGKIVGNDIFITSIASKTNDNGVTCFKKVYPNDRLALLEIDDYKSIFNETVLNIKKEIPNPSLTLSINCVLRFLFLQQSKDLPFLEKTLFQLGPNLGCVSFGEQYNTQHVNQTMVLLVFE